ncbi:hypothetical protein LCGC14_2308430, partial [marine sediment metagenome]
IRVAALSVRFVIRVGVWYNQTGYT